MEQKYLRIKDIQLSDIAKMTHGLRYVTCAWYYSWGHSETKICAMQEVTEYTSTLRMFIAW